MLSDLKKLNISFSLVAVFVILSGCATQKKKEDKGAIGIAYNNMTARYNGYYNASVLMAESQLALEQQHSDNYNKILPIYKYVEADNPKAEAANLDKAVEKVSVVVNLHRISHWTDDCYLLFGKAKFMAQDYEAAQEAFEFLTGEFDPVEVAKREAKMKAKRGKKKAVKKGKAPSTSSKADSGDDEPVKLTKKEKERLAKKKRKEREKERKQKIKDTKRKRSGKSVKSKDKGEVEEEVKTPSRKDRMAEKERQKEKEKEAAEVEDTAAPGSITLGNLESKVTESEAENYFLKHRPVYQEGLLWQARTYTERENFTNAERLLTQLEKSPSTFDDVRADVAIAKADFYLKQKKYEGAVEPLEAAISLSKDRKMKARLSFILGQVQQKLKNGQGAFAAFEQVLKFSPTYEMEFSARLNLATAGVGSSEESVKQLERMLKEEKNKDFQDQIYYALALIALDKGDEPLAIKNLELSLAKSSRNMSQKAEAYLLLADLYFKKENFVDAKLYYDSTRMVLPENDERAERVIALANNLTEIAQNIQIIALQDSLLRISRMTDEERKTLAFNIKKQQDEEKLRKLKEQAAATTVAKPGGKGGNAVNIGVNQSKFWAYDDKEVKKGTREFQRAWGTRQLADNWRRSDQSSINTSEEIVAAKTSDVMTDEDVAAILKDVPDTPEKVAAADREIEAAYFALGGLYRDRLQNYPKSLEALQKLMERYPETQYQLDALYYMYLTYKDMGDQANAQLYFDKIVKGYPESHYAKILTDPNYLKSFADQETKLNRYYDETYAAFETRQYKTAHERISKVGEKFGGTNKLQPRFALLNAMCIGNLQGREDYIEALKDVIAKYGDQSEAVRAREILRLLGENVGSGPGQQREKVATEGQVGAFQVQDDQLHYVIVVFKKDISLNDAKVAITEFNNKYFSLQKLRMNNIYLGDGDAKFPLIAIRRYKDKAEAMDYYSGVQKNRSDFLDSSKFDFEVFPIGQDNYRELLKSKNIDEYKTFFQINYLK